MGWLLLMAAMAELVGVKAPGVLTLGGVLVVLAKAEGASALALKAEAARWMAVCWMAARLGAATAEPEGTSAQTSSTACLMPGLHTMASEEVSLAAQVLGQRHGPEQGSEAAMGVLACLMVVTTSPLAVLA